MDGDQQPRTTGRDAGAGQVGAVALVGGVGAGLGLWLLTILIESSDLSGDGWSLAGNGALIVPFLGVPAVLVAGILLLGRLVGVGSGRWWLVAVASVVLVLGLVIGLAAGFMVHAPS